ncbi:hypothetical protein Tco_0057947 [Tanacetum coccineum]
MFDPPLSDDAIWSLALQQKMINWRHQELASPKQTALCCTKALATPEQMATGKEISNPLTTDSLLKTIREDEMLLKIKSQISSASTLVSTGRRVSINLEAKRQFSRPARSMIIGNLAEITVVTVQPLQLRWDTKVQVQGRFEDENEDQDEE